MVKPVKQQKLFNSVYTWLWVAGGLLALIALATMGVIVSTSITADRVKKNPSDCDVKRYPIPFVCGMQPGPPLRLRNGRYTTLIHIHNHQSHKIVLEKKISLDFPALEGGPGSQNPGFVSNPIVEELDPCHSIMVDCGEIPSEFNITGPEPPYFIGLLSVTVNVDDEVTVWAEQTITSVAGSPATNIPSVSVYPATGMCAKGSAGVLKPTLWIFFFLLFLYLIE